jgi:DNA-binding MurR/RpiR family transcriptional regulator
MTPAARESEFRARLIRRTAQLPPQQRLIADYLLEHLQTVPFLSVPELARQTGVSDATVVRFAQRIGYNGFSELKMDLVELLQDRLGGAAPSEPSELPGDVLEQVAGLEITNVQRSLKAIDRTVFAEVGEAVFGADHVYAFGMGVSAHLAEIACYNLTQIGLRATPLSTRFTSPREQLVTLREQDLLIALSFPPYSRQTLDLLTDAAARGAATVALCDRPAAPAAHIARWTLPVRSDNMMFTNAIAAVTVLFNALAAEIATKHSDHALEAFAHINRVLAENPDILPSDR